MTPPRTPALALCALLLAPLAAAQAPAPLEVGFAAPAQAEGELAAEGLHWLLVLFRQEGAQVRIDLGPATARNQTWLEASDRRDDGGGWARQPVPLPPATQEFPDGLRGRLGAGAPWASLFVQAESLSLRLPGARSSLVLAEAGQLASEHLPAMPYPATAVDPPASGTGAASPFVGLGVPESGAALAVEAVRSGQAFPFELRASGVTRVAWHNLTLACGGSCPDGGAPGGWSLGLRGETRLERLSYLDVAARGGTAEGAGSAIAIAGGAGRLDARVAGSLRLPDATLSGPCPAEACPDPGGRTLQADGGFLLAGLRPSPAGAHRLEASLTGRFDGARFDEAAVAAFSIPEEVAIGVAVAVAGGSALALLGLLVRSARPPALRHPRRRQLHQLIVGEPGLSSRSLQRRLGWARGPFLFHLRRLLEEGHVAQQRYRNTVRYFENHGRYTASWQQVVQLGDADASRLHGWLLGHPGLDQAAIVREAAGWGWGRGKVRRVLRGLGHSGLLEARAEGRRVVHVAKAAAAIPAGRAEPAGPSTSGS